MFLIRTPMVVALSLAMGSVMAQQVAAVNIGNDRLEFDSKATIDTNRNGLQVYKVGGHSLVFEPKSLTLTNPEQFVNTPLDPQVRQDGDKWVKTYTTDPVPGSRCPVNLSWNVTYTITEAEATVTIDGTPTPVKVQRSEQAGTWACGRYGGDKVIVTLEYAPEMNVLVSFSLDMYYQGKSNVAAAKLLSVNRATVVTAQR